MKFNKKKIISLALAILLMIGSTLTLSSCLFVYDGVFGDYDGEGGDDEDDGKIPTLPNDNSQANNNGGSSDSDDTIFYPSGSDSSTENLSNLNKTLLSTVVITSHFGASPSAGSGVIYKLDKETGDAYILTNFHVVYDQYYGFCDKAVLYLYGMQLAQYGIEAHVVGGSSAYDIAVLKVTGSSVLKNSHALAATPGNSDNVRVFDKVAVIGNPEAFGMAATMGIVSVDSESLDMTGAMGKPIELRVIRIDAAVNEGNSGGGLYDMQGNLIGIVAAKRIGSDVDNMAYAIPSNLAVNLAENIIANCDGDTKTAVQKAMIGITITAKVSGVVIDEESGALTKAEVVEISDFTDTCTIKDRLKVGDVVRSITVDGKTATVTRMYHILDLMLTARVGSTVSLSIERDGQTFEITTTITQNNITTVK